MKEKDTITPAELPLVKCVHCKEDGTCEGMEMAAKCHPHRGTTTTYHTATHSLEVVCFVCGRHVVTVALDPLPPRGKALLS